MAFGRRTACGGDQKGFGLSVENTGFARFLFFVDQTFVQAALGKALAGTGDGERDNLDLLGDGGIFVCPTFFGFVGQKQNAGAFALALGVALGLAQAQKLGALGFGQRHVIFFRGHWISLLRLIHSTRLVY